MTNPPDIKTLRQFGLLLSVVITFWLSIYCWLTGTDLLTPWPVWLVIIILADLALFKPAWLEKPFAGWMKLVEFLNYLITYTLLGSIFLLIVTPVALISRLSGRKANQQKQPLPDSYRVKSAPLDSKDMEHPY